MSLLDAQSNLESRSATQRAASDGARPQYLAGPQADFWMLGGSSLLLVPLLLVLPVEAVKPRLALVLFLGSLVINYPHFAVSYRIFYENFAQKVGVAASDRVLALRYAFAGVVVPAVLVAAAVVLLATGNGQALGWGFNAMVFFVGWHYVKQGYGMAMVDAALKRRFFRDLEKRVLLANGYAVWLTGWSLTNRSSERNEYLGLPVRNFDLPDIVLGMSIAATIVTTLATLVVLGRRAIERSPTAWIGVVAYLVSLYVWTVLVRFNPLVLIVAPALHSLQYLHVVRRYQTNRSRSAATVRSWRDQYGRSVALGIVMFLGLPTLLDQTVAVDTASLGALPFTFAFFIAINVHHYFLDNVMWRRENHDVSKHLFGH